MLVFFAELDVCAYRVQHFAEHWSFLLQRDSVLAATWSSVTVL
jgi:hypothetical protein